MMCNIKVVSVCVWSGDIIDDVSDDIDLHALASTDHTYHLWLMCRDELLISHEWHQIDLSILLCQFMGSLFVEKNYHLYTLHIDGC